MTRTQHYEHPTPAFPVACLAFADDTTLLLGGGGGPSRTGIKNKLKYCTVSPDGKKLEEVAEQVFEPGEDSPTSMAINAQESQVVVGVNATEESIKKASSPSAGNNHCRTFSYSDKRFKLIKETQTIDAVWSDDYPYQKYTTFAPSFKLLAVGTTDNTGTSSVVTILSYPTLKVLWRSNSGDPSLQDELVDIDFAYDSKHFAITTPKTIHVYDITSITSEKTPDSEAIHVTKTGTIPLPDLGADMLSFRNAKYSRDPTHVHNIHTIINSNPKPAPRSSKGGSKRPAVVKKGFCCNFEWIPLSNEKSTATTTTPTESDQNQNTGRWDMTLKRELGKKPISAFQVSSDGGVLAYASADFSIGLLEARTLAPLLKILHAHSFAITALAFNPSGSLLASAGADNTIRLIVIPPSFGSHIMTVFAVLVALLILVVAYLVQKHT